MTSLILKKEINLNNIIHKGTGKRYAREFYLEDKLYRNYLLDIVEKEIEILRLQTLDDEFRMKRKKQNDLYDRFILSLKEKRKQKNIDKG